MRRIQSPCCNDNGAILMFGNDYVEASPGSVLASKPRHRARQESSLCLLGRQGKCCIITKETWKSALHWTFPSDRREEHQGEGEGSFLQKLCHWLNSSGLHTFASWWISQNIPVFKRAEMKLISITVTDTVTSFVGATGRSVQFPRDINLVKSLLPQVYP